MPIGHVRMPQSSLLLLKFSCFSLTDASQIFLSLWLPSRALKNLLFINFASDLTAFMEVQFLETHSQSSSSLQTFKNKY